MQQGEMNDWHQEQRDVAFLDKAQKTQPGTSKSNFFVSTENVLRGNLSRNTLTNLPLY